MQQTINNNMPSEQNIEKVTTNSEQKIIEKQLQKNQEHQEQQPIKQSSIQQKKSHPYILLSQISSSEQTQSFPQNIILKPTLTTTQIITVKQKSFEWKSKSIELQQLLKQQHSLLWTQNEQKVSFEKKLSETILSYHKNKILSLSGLSSKTLKKSVPSAKIPSSSSKHSNKVLSKIKQGFETMLEGSKGDSKLMPQKKYTQQKVFLEDQGFGDSSYYIKEVLLELSKNPELVITIIKKYQQFHHLSTTNPVLNYDSIVSCFIHSMFENIVDDDIYNKDYFLILETAFELIIQNVKHYYQINLSEDQTIAGQILRGFLQKQQIKNYSKQVIKNTILQVGKIDHQLIFMKQEITQKDSRGLGSSSKGIKLDNKKISESLVKDQRIQPRTKVDNPKSKMAQYVEALQVKDQKMRIRAADDKRHASLPAKPKAAKCVSKELLHYIGITQQIQFPTFISSNANTQIKKQQEINKQWAAMLSHKESMIESNADIVLVKNIVLIFFSDLFKMLYTLPLGLRIACKLFYETLEKKFNQKKACFQVLAEYVLGLCVVKNITIIVDENTNQRSKLGNYVKNNLDSVSKIIFGVIRNDYKNIPKSFEYEFNLIVGNIRISLYNYLSQILNIDSKKYVKSLRMSGKVDSKTFHSQQHNKSSSFNSQQKIKSYTICLSLMDIKNLFAMIKQCKKQLKQINQNDKLIKRIQRIEMVTSDVDIFRQRLDRITGNYIKPQNAYVMYYQLQLPPELSVNYIKYHEGYFKNNKLIKMLKLLMLSLERLDKFIEYNQSETFVSFLDRLSNKSKQFFSSNLLINSQNIDHIPVQVKLKYLLSLIRQQYNESQYEQKLFEIVEKMGNQVKQRIQYYKTIWDKSKQYYLKSLSCVIERNQILLNYDAVLQKNFKTKRLDQFLQKTKISVCLTSPLTREKQVLLKTNVMKDMSQQQKGKLWLENQARCIHTALNLQFIKSLTGQYDKTRTNQQSHCNSIAKFTQILCSLPQVKRGQGQDIGVKQVFFDFIKYMGQLAVKRQQLKDVLEEDSQWLQQCLEQKLCKKIYDKLYPKDPTYQDVSFYLRLKTLDFITYEHLKIKPELRFEKMWQLAGKQLLMMDKVKTASQKLSCINEFSKIIISSYYLINNSLQESQPATAQDIFPIIVYCLIKSAPKRIISNLKFIEVFSPQNKLLSKQGYSFSQLKSAIQFCDQLTEKQLNFELQKRDCQKSIEFQRSIYEKQIEYGIYFLLLRKKINPQQQKKKLTFLKDLFAKIKVQ